MKTLAIVACLTLATGLFAAEAPKSVEKLTKAATHVVTGLVTASSSKEVKGINGEGSIDVEHSISVKISEVTAGDELKKNKVIVCTTRRAKKGGVPFGEKGLEPVIWSMGQESIPKIDDQAQFYLKKQSDGTYRAITPNGIKVR